MRGGLFRNLVLAIVVVVAAGCVGGSADGEALIDAIADQVEAGLEPGDPPFSRADAECIAAAYVDTLGVETMDELGLDEASIREGAGPGDAALTDGQVEDVAAAMGRCLDMAQVMSDSLAYADLSEETLTCLADAFEGDIEEGLLRNTIRFGELLPSGDTNVAFAIFDALGRCVTPQELQRLETDG